jgi:7-cyano-7-deazaguanine reductase|tara:strand:- start:3409 stop:3834 length:426 start_codon:yes stop_codon:yes gene_type:complete
MEKSKKRNWNKNREILKAIKNPSKEGYEIKMKIPELTFEGVRGQPDFAHLYITFYPGESIIELKSLKEYFFAFRSQIYSYERIINVIYDDMKSVYNPERLRLVLVCNPRGGISSKLTVDSDWSVRGGKEICKDWLGQTDAW